MKENGAGVPIPNPSPTDLLQPQYAIGYQMLGAPTSWIPAPLSSVLNVATPGWAPTPNPSATEAAGLMHFWQIGGKDTLCSYNGHDGSAAQYPEWANQRHANAFVDLKAAMAPIRPLVSRSA